MNINEDNIMDIIERLEYIASQDTITDRILDCKLTTHKHGCKCYCHQLLPKNIHEGTCFGCIFDSDNFKEDMYEILIDCNCVDRRQLCIKHNINMGLKSARSSI